jgi:hypothetical protein
MEPQRLEIYPGDLFTVRLKEGEEVLIGAMGKAELTCRGADERERSNEFWPLPALPHFLDPPAPWIPDLNRA